MKLLHMYDDLSDKWINIDPSKIEVSISQQDDEAEKFVEYLVNNGVTAELNPNYNECQSNAEYDNYDLSADMLIILWDRYCNS